MEKKDSKSTITHSNGTTPKYDMWAKFSEDQKYLFDSLKEKIVAMTDIAEPVKGWLCKQHYIDIMIYLNLDLIM